MTIEKVVVQSSGNGSVAKFDLPIKDADGKPVQLLLPEGSSPGILTWKNYNPILYMLTGGLNIRINTIVDQKRVIRKFLLDQVAEQGFDLDEFDIGFPEFTKKIVKSTIKKYNPVNYIYTLWKGFVQSGKTQAICCQTIMNFDRGLHTLIVVRNLTGDRKQLVSRLKDICDKLNSALDEDSKLPLVICQDTRQYAKYLATHPHQPTIVVALANKTQLCKFLDVVNEYKLHQKFVAIIDEVDYLDHEGPDAKSQILITLKSMCRYVIGVTATPLDTMVQEEIKHDNVKIIKPPFCYKSISQYQWFSIDPITSSKEIFTQDPNLKGWLEKFSKWKPVFVEQYDEHHPIMYLLSGSTTKEYMYNVQDYTSSVYSNKVVNMVYNGDGVKLWAGNLGVISIKNKEYKIDDNGYYIIKNILVSDVIKFLKLNGGVAKFPRILIISGELARRGISYVSSDYSECRAKNTLVWHTIGEYFRCSTKMSQPDLLQAGGRISGNFPDNIPLRFYTTLKIQSDIIKSYKIADKLLTEAIRLSQSNNLTLKDTMLQVPVTKDELISNRKITRTNKIDARINIVTDVSQNIGKYLRILPDTLAPVSKKYYDYFVEMLDAEEHGLGTGKWFDKQTVIDHMANIYGELNLRHVRDTSHPWHDINKVGHHQATSDETTHGLLFYQLNPSDNRWSVRYNI